MKKIISLFLFAAAIISTANAAGSPINKNSGAAPTGTLQKMWIDYGVTQGNKYGMLIHIACTVYDAKDRTVYLGAYFKEDDGTPDSYIIHEDKTDQYHTKGGRLVVGKSLTPAYATSVYNDIQLFFPYEEFDLSPGNYDLTIDVQLVYMEGGTFAWLKQYNIQFTQNDDERGASNNKSMVKTQSAPTNGPRATFEKMWVDYDVKENGVLGMKLHFKFTAYDMKDTAAFVAVYFLYNDDKGGQLKDKNGKYNSSSGNVAVYADIKPAYTTANYDDLQIFMPYDELELSPGTYELEMDAKLIYDRGGLISNFTYYGFRYTEPN